MRQSKARQKFADGRCARICSTGHYLPFYVRYAAHFNFDAIWLDLEHRAMSDRHRKRSKEGKRSLLQALSLCAANALQAHPVGISSVVVAPAASSPAGAGAAAPAGAVAAARRSSSRNTSAGPAADVGAIVGAHA